MRLRDGAGVAEVAAAFGCRGRRSVAWGASGRCEAGRSDRRLGFYERDRIGRGLAAGESIRAIARELGRAPSTISREVNRCGGGGRYRALAAERKALERSRRPKPTKWLLAPAAVEAGLEQRWSPEQIAAQAPR